MIACDDARAGLRCETLGRSARRPWRHTAGVSFVAFFRAPLRALRDVSQTVRVILPTQRRPEHAPTAWGHRISENASLTSSWSMFRAARRITSATPPQQSVYTTPLASGLPLTRPCVTFAVEEGYVFIRELMNQNARAVQRTMTGLTYGNDAECRRCGQRHAHTNRDTIAVETNRTLLMASRIAERVGAGMPASRGSPAVKKQEGMVGVLIAADGRMAVAVSGGGNSKDAAVRTAVDQTLAAVSALYPYLIFVGNIEGQIPTVSGQFLSRQEFDHSAGDGLTAVPGTCAGPKLMAYAITNGWARPYAMSEAWSARKQDETAKFGKSEPIESCNTCCRLIPMMLCG
jgi:hypothetical protein